MKKSFIDRIFPHSPGDALPQYENDLSGPSGTPSPPRILLQDSVASSSRSGNASSTLSTRRTTQTLTASLVRYDDPFLPVERAAKTLERTLQSLLDAQSEGLLAGIGNQDTNDASSAGSLTPTPSLATSPQRHIQAPTIPIRQPKGRKITLRGARRGLVKSMAEFARLKDWELTLIDEEVAARANALKQASNLESQKKLLEDDIAKINADGGAATLRAEAQTVEEEIQQLETRLLELKVHHRQLISRAREIESSRASRLSSYAESLRLNDNKVKSFLHQPPITQSLGRAPNPGMYALKPDRRTLQMAEQQWTSEVEVLNFRKTEVEKEKRALEEGSKLWQQVVHRVLGFETELRAQTNDLSQSQLRAFGGDALTETSVTAAKDGLLQVVFTKLCTLITFLEDALAKAESKNWNLLICSIGAELAAFDQAREVLQEMVGVDNSLPDHPSGNEDLVDAEQEDAPQKDHMSGGLVETDGIAPRSPGESSNHSLEETLREFGKDLDRGKQKETYGGLGIELPRRGLDAVDNSLGSQSRTANDQTSESEDDDPGPEFLLSHT
ncbi:hypothetical protein A1O3_08832 [Capronia epimyces CBS 606.96]|uniref:Autophagy-related protein 28 n=1 Tax=Capronia epimyces CBS 606.96 TaxID=1182542 RepID=W9XPU2_9EURO|nr:uncharacterized protein A1O3_08832 [Capronia epimyces CBS 606.96]EXJ79330.1 hypothetical protein A1O3_08832 [Capronia epimyces CBS 606.96]